MAGGIVCLYGLVICGYLLLYGPQRLLVAALPAAIASGNGTGLYEQSQGNVSIPSGDIWQITETAGNETVEDPDDVLFRGGWTKNKSQKLYLETEEGWINSGMIAKDPFIPYRTAGVSNRLGNDTEEWKELLAKPEPDGSPREGRISKVQFNERRDIPFQFHWQANPKRFFNKTKAP